MRRRTSPASFGGAPLRPVGSKGTAKRAARIPTATSLRLLPRSATSAARRCFSSPGIRTSTSFLLALMCYQVSLLLLQLPADVEDPLHDRHPRGRVQEVDRPREQAPRGEEETGDDDGHALRAAAE